MASWLGSVTRRLGFSTGFIDASDLHVFVEDQFRMVIFSTKKTAIDEMCYWWGGEVVERKRWFKTTDYAWTLTGIKAEELLHMVSPFLLTEGPAVKAALVKAKLKRRLSATIRAGDA